VIQYCGIRERGRGLKGMEMGREGKGGEERRVDIERSRVGGGLA